MIKNKQKTIIVISILAALVVLLTVLFVILNKRASDAEEKEKQNALKNAPTCLIEGEYFSLDKVTLYHYTGLEDYKVSRKWLLSVDIVNNIDNIKTSITSKAGDEKLSLKGYEGIFEFNNAISGSPFLTMIISGLTMQSDKNPPIRDCTEEYMAELGLTEDTCDASYTLKYLDEDNNVYEQTVFIGHHLIGSEENRYVAVKGRNSVYTMFDLDAIFDVTTERCISPIIYQRYKESEVATSIKQLFIQYGERPIVTVVNTTELGAAYGEAVYTLRHPVITLADSDYVLNVITTLFTNFSGDEVVSINPDKEILKKYGLYDTNNMYFISALHASEDASTFGISALQEDGYYYILSPQYKEYEIDTIIRIPGAVLSFLSDDDEKLVKWAATNTPLSGLYKYLHEDADSKQSGVKQITIKTPTFEETFYISTEKRVIDGTERICLKVVPKSGKSNLFFEDDYSVLNTDDSSASYKINQFRNFYTYLISFPMPIRFCTLTDEEIVATKTEKNFMFEITVVTNDGEAERYTYYANEKNPGYVIREESIGSFDGENYNFDSTDVLFDVTREHLSRITNALDKLIKGEFIDPRNDLY